MNLFGIHKIVLDLIIVYKYKVNLHRCLFQWTLRSLQKFDSLKKTLSWWSWTDNADSWVFVQVAIVLKSLSDESVQYADNIVHLTDDVKNKHRRKKSLKKNIKALSCFIFLLKDFKNYPLCNKQDRGFFLFYWNKYFVLWLRIAK